MSTTEEEAIRIAMAVSHDMGRDVETELRHKLNNTASASGLLEFAAIAYVIHELAVLALRKWKDEAPSDEGRLDSMLSLVGAIPTTVKVAGRAEALPVNQERALESLHRVINRISGPQLLNAADNPSSALTSLSSWYSSRSKSKPISVSPFADMDMWWLREELHWEPQGAAEGFKSITVPKGFTTDFASVPGILWSALPATGDYGNIPAIVHDWLYWNKGVTRATADSIFLAAMEQFGVSALKRRTIYSAVRLFGRKSWDQRTEDKKHGRGGVLAIFPDSATTRWSEWSKRPDVFKKY